MLQGPITEKANKSSFSNSRFRGHDSFLSGNKEHKKTGFLCPTKHWSMHLSVEEPRPNVAWISKHHILTGKFTNIKLENNIYNLGDWSLLTTSSIKFLNPQDLSIVPKTYIIGSYPIQVQNQIFKLQITNSG